VTILETILDLRQVDLLESLINHLLVLLHLDLHQALLLLVVDLLNSHLPHQADLHQDPHQADLLLDPHQADLHQDPHQVDPLDILINLHLVPHQADLLLDPHQVDLHQVPHQADLHQVPHQVDPLGILINHLLGLHQDLLQFPLNLGKNQIKMTIGETIMMNHHPINHLVTLQILLHHLTNHLHPRMKT